MNEEKSRHEMLWMAVQRMPEDYVHYGTRERSHDIGETEYYVPDCAGGCF
jgi:hypothetical protein